MAGHSHWAGIKHKKGKQINKDLKFFQNYQEICCCKTGG